MVVFGGVKKNKWLNTLAVLDTTRWKWCPKKVLGDAPPPRSYHTATTVSSSLVVIFGGNDELKSFDGVHVLDTGGSKWAWMHPAMIGSGPSRRTGHSATLMPDGSTVLIYGGWDPMGEVDDDEEEIFDDAFLLDTNSWSWRKATIEGKRERRVGHSAVVVDGHTDSSVVEILVFGGRGEGQDYEGSFAEGCLSFKVHLA